MQDSSASDVKVKVEDDKMDVDDAKPVTNGNGAKAEQKKTKRMNSRRICGA